MGLIELTDIIRINPDPEIIKLTKRAKRKFIDSVLQKGSNGKRGLLITYNLSSSGRRINNRIYTPRGQKAGVDSWTKPYPKPLILNHDEKTEPIGRIAAVRWESLHDQALRFFGHVRQFVDFQNAFDADDPQKIYKKLKDHGLLTNQNWPGLGALVADALITDEVSVEKFVDGRYLTFSAGTHTDRYACGICGEDWTKGGPCDHRPGAITEDGDIGIFVTGIFSGDEASVVNVPANSMSQVLSMKFMDSPEKYVCVGDECRMVDESTIYITDSKFTIGEPMSPLEKLQKLDVRDLARQIFESTTEDDLLDALEGDSHYEQAWLIRIHDAMHSEYDWRMRYTEPNQNPMAQTPTDVYKLHAMIHNISDEKDFRGSLVNGPLDNYDESGVENGKYLLPSQEEDSDKDSGMLNSEKANEFLDLLLQKLKSTQEKRDEDCGCGKGAAASDAKEKEEEEETQETKVSGLLKNVFEEDKELSDVERQEVYDAIVAEIELTDKVLTAAARKKLSASTFCGPNRSYPINDRAHAINALARARQHASPALYAKIRACVCRKFSGLPACSKKGSSSDGQEDSWTLSLIQEAVDKEALIHQDLSEVILTDEAWKELPDSAFIDSHRSIPVHDVPHGEALARVVNGVGLTDELKDRVLGLINARLETLQPTKPEKDTKDKGDCGCKKAAELKDDYIQALKQVDLLKNENASLRQQLADKSTPHATVPNEDSKKIDRVENPSVDSSDSTAPSASSKKGKSFTGEFEHKVLEEYKKIFDKDGELAANHYISRKIRRGYLPSNFDVKKLIG